MITTCRTLIELLEYVLLKAALLGLSGMPVDRSCSDKAGVVGGGASRLFIPFDDDDDKVSRESVPFSELAASGGTGGIASPGAKKPFLVVAGKRAFKENKPFAFGAEATRRMNLEADALIALGLSGIPFRGRDEGKLGACEEEDDCMT